MSKREVYDCDSCGAENASTGDHEYRMHLSVGSERSPAGDSDTVWQDIDLCHKCAIRKLQYMVGSFKTHEDRAGWVESHCKRIPKLTIDKD